MTLSQTSSLAPIAHPPDIYAVSANGGISGPGAPIELQAAKEHLEQLRVAMSTIASQHTGATTHVRIASRVMFVVMAATVITYSLLNPGTAATAASWLPENAKGFNILVPIVSTAGSVGSWVRATMAEKGMCCPWPRTRRLPHRYRVHPPD